MIKIFFITLIALSTSLLANKVKVVDVKANCSPSQICSFDVTLEHEGYRLGTLCRQMGNLHSTEQTTSHKNTISSPCR
jgi:hypothetical protein